MGYRLVAVSGKFGGNRRLPTDKVNPAPTPTPTPRPEARGCRVSSPRLCPVQ